MTAVLFGIIGFGLGMISAVHSIYSKNIERKVFEWKGKIYDIVERK